MSDDVDDRAVELTPGLDAGLPDVPAFQATFIRYPVDEAGQAELEAIKAQSSRLGRAGQLLGAAELTSRSLYNAVLIEFVGTAVFVYLHVAIVVSTGATGGPLVVGLLHGVLLTLFILQFAASSGAHFNSLITAATLCTGHTPPLRALLYLLAQCLGAFVGALCMAGTLPAATARAVQLGACSPGSAASSQAFAVDFFFSMNLLFAAYGTAFNAKQRLIYGPVLAPVFIGFCLFLNIVASSGLFPPPFAAGFNPSMCFGTAAALAVIDTSQLLDQLWIYWTAPMAASVVHALIYRLAPPHHQDEYAVEAREAKIKRD